MPHTFRSPSMSFPLLIITVFSLCLYLIRRRLTRISVQHVSGPEPESFWLGNLREFLTSQAGEADWKWQAAYGDVVKFKATFGEDRLLVSDPKALQHIYHSYNFPKPPERRELSRIIGGRGILWAEDLNHRRLRKIMLPSFGSLQSKAYVPIFTASASRLVGRWKDIIAASPSQSSTINVSLWVSRATLDAIGEAAFDYNFSALENDKNILGKALVNLLMDAFADHTNASIFVQDMLQYLPTKVLEYISDNAGGKVKGLRDTGSLMTEISKNLVDTKSEALLHGKSTSKDLMSRLVRANASEKLNSSLTEEEMISMMRTVLLAGHETTANSLCWGLLDLARNPHVQTRLRKEIWNMEKIIQERGDTEFTAADFEAMPYLVAVTKETLRYRPASYSTFRQAGRDDVLPLSTPIRTADGTVITELPIPKGLKIVTSINGYNRNTEIFGKDAHSYNPQRWLDETVQKKANIGPYANLLSFASGTRACIGWRFAVLEMQAFLVELIGNFEFSLTPEISRIKREACLVMIPLIEGEEAKGAQLPLNVKVAVRD